MGEIMKAPRQKQRQIRCKLANLPLKMKYFEN